jgi:hypothetical protein
VPPAATAAALADPNAAPGPVIGVELSACTVFYSLLRLSGVATIDLTRFRGEDSARALFGARVLYDGMAPMQKLDVVRVSPDGSVAFTVEALIDRARAIDGAVLELSYEGAASPWSVSTLAKVAGATDMRSILPDFQAEVASVVAAGRRPTMLDIGGRARSQVQRSEITEGHRRSDRAARSGIGVAHHRRAHVPGRIQAFDDRSVIAQRPTVNVGADAALGAEITGNHLRRVVRRMREFTEVRVWLVPRVAIVAVIRALAAVKVLIHPGAREAVESLNGVGERLGGQSGGGG